MTIFEKKELIRLTYPTVTDLDASDAEFRPRALQVLNVRDISRDPLTPIEFLRRPLLNRGRWLVTAKDIQERKIRQFYLASSIEYQQQPDLKIGLYHEGDLLEVLEVFEPTRRERIAACNYIKSIVRNEDLGDCQICVFADDLRLFGAGAKVERESEETFLVARSG